VICGQIRRRAAGWPIGAVCFSCYHAARSRPGQCASCDRVRVLVAGTDLDADTGLATPTVCGSCEGSKFVYLCRRCGGGEEPYKGGLCVRCAVRDQLQSAFGGPGADPASPATILVEALGNSRRPRSVMKWLSNPRGGARVVSELLRKNITVDHAALDTFDEREVWSLRRSLVELGALPERHEHLARLDSLLAKTVAALPPEPRHLVQTYGSWWLLRRSRQRFERTGRFTYNSFRAVGRRLEHVIALLTWLSKLGVPLSQLDQSRLDLWLAEPKNDPEAASDFLRWASQHHLAPQLTVIYRAQRDVDVSMTDAERWAVLTRCLRETAIPDDVRAAGTLVLLYGIQLERIVELTKDHLHTACTRGSSVPDGFSVYLGGPVILIPPQLANILARLPAETVPRGTPLITSDNRRTAWLFPGRGASGHAAAATLAGRLKALGLRARHGRNAALISLAADLPAPVISDLFGISVSASVSWARRAGRDWHGYIAALRQREREVKAGHHLRQPFPPEPL
jgi:hypothetical protein